MTWAQASQLRQGDLIVYERGGETLIGRIVDPPHVFKRDRGQVVFVRVADEFVVHTRIKGLTGG